MALIDDEVAAFLGIWNTKTADLNTSKQAIMAGLAFWLFGRADLAGRNVTDSQIKAAIQALPVDTATWDDVNPKVWDAACRFFASAPPGQKALTAAEVTSIIQAAQAAGGSQLVQATAIARGAEQAVLGKLGLAKT